MDNNASIRIRNRVSRVMANVLLISGVDGNPEETYDIVVRRFGSKIADIVSSCIALQKAIGEDVVSSELRPSCPRFNAAFATEEMEDINHNGRQQKSQATHEKALVLCTTEIGLRRYEKQAIKDGGERAAIIVMLKARVALTSLVDEMVKGS